MSSISGPMDNGSVNLWTMYVCMYVTIYFPLPVIIPLTLHTWLFASGWPNEPHLYDHKWQHMHHDAEYLYLGMFREKYYSVSEACGACICIPFSSVFHHMEEFIIHFGYHAHHWFHVLLINLRLYTSFSQLVTALTIFISLPSSLLNTLPKWFQVISAWTLHIWRHNSTDSSETGHFIFTTRLQ
jgi:hypothetical protein